MLFRLSLVGVKSKNIFLNFFALASIFPILIAIFIFDDYIAPLIGNVDRLNNAFYMGISAMFLLSLLSFLLIYRWINSLENVAGEIASKSTAVANREEEFGTQKIEVTDVFTKQEINGHHEGNEIQSLIRSFNAIFETAADQLAERNRLKELLARLIGISSCLTAELEFDRLFPLIISNVTEAMQAERTSLYVVDWERHELWTKVSEGVDQIRLPLGQGISGRVAETGEMLNISDAWDLPYYDRSFDLNNNFRTRSVLCIPIKNRASKTIGVLQVINKKDKECFDGEDEVFLNGLTSQISIALENSLLVDEILLSFTSSISTLSAVVDARHHFTAGHSQRVKEYSLMIAETMNMPKEDIETLKYAALLHDIGKIGISDNVLMKYGAYSSQDWEEMKEHPATTKAILDNFHFPHHLRQVPEIAYQHHEKLDGTGYPEGITEDKLSMGAKIIAVADVFDAMTSLRDYPKYAFGEIMDCKPMPLPKVIDILKDQAGIQFDREVVEAFMKSLEKALLLYRGKHFSPSYVDDTIRNLNQELLT